MAFQAIRYLFLFRKKRSKERFGIFREDDLCAEIKLLKNTPGIPWVGLQLRRYIIYERLDWPRNSNKMDVFSNFSKTLLLAIGDKYL